MSIFLLRSFYFILGIISLIDLTPALAENYNIGEINELLKKEKIELDKLKAQLEGGICMVWMGGGGKSRGDAKLFVHVRVM